MVKKIVNDDDWKEGNLDASILGILPRAVMLATALSDHNQVWPIIESHRRNGQVLLPPVNLAIAADRGGKPPVILPDSCPLSV